MLGCQTVCTACRNQALFTGKSYHFLGVEHEMCLSYAAWSFIGRGLFVGFIKIFCLLKTLSGCIVLVGFVEIMHIHPMEMSFCRNHLFLSYSFLSISPSMCIIISSTFCVFSPFSIVNPHQFIGECGG